MKSENTTSIINEFINNYEHRSDVDFLRFIGVDDGKKCSVLCQYDPENEVISYCRDNIYQLISEREYYYGLSPKFTEKNILIEVMKSNIRDYSDLKTILDKNDRYFNLHKNLIDFIEPLYARTILRVVSRFGVLIKIPRMMRDPLQAWIENKPNFIDKITYSFKEKNNELFFCLRLGIPEIALNELDDSEFYLQEAEGGFELSSVNKSIKFVDIFKSQLRPTERNHKDEQELNEYLTLIDGDAYYSGVLPRVKRIERKRSFSNSQVEIIKFFVERTTYATVDSFDNCEINQHPLLDKWKKELLQFERLEDRNQKMLFDYNGPLGNKELLENVNKYLSASFNTHILAVSGNLLLEDGSIIITERSKNAIDTQTYYCSVNGQSEFNDSNVEMYKESVIEDYPSLIADEHVRNDFNEELNRETKAELNVHTTGAWNYYGVSILGIKNRRDELVSKRRMHFNVLAYNYTHANFIDILQAQETATESYENQSMYLLKPHFVNSRVDYLRRIIYGGMTFLRKNDATIGYISALIFIILNLVLKREFDNDMLNTVSTITSVVLSVTIISHVLFSKIGQWKNERILKSKTIHINHFTNQSASVQLEKFFDSFEKKINQQGGSNSTLHMILIVMLINYITNKR